MKQSSAYKRVKTLYGRKLKKPDDEKKLSVNKVSELVFGEFGMHIHKRTIQHAVAARKVGVTPLMQGMKRKFKALTFQALVNAFEALLR